MMNKKLMCVLAMCAMLLAAPVFAQEEATEDPLPSLKELYAGKFLIGTAADLRGYSEAELANVKYQYDINTPENSMKPQPTQPNEGQFNFSTPDFMVEWCEENGVKVWGHTLMWHSQSPRWFFNPGPDGEPASRELKLERLKDHIDGVAGHYKGKVVGWDVVNEAIADGGDGSTENLRNFSWYTEVGPDAINMAFKYAKEADPDAKLYYNDYNIEQGAVENKGKHASSLKLLKRLIDEGVPIDGVGIQGHWHLDSNLADVEKAIENYAELGLEVAITELDVTSTGSNSGAFGVQRGGQISEENHKQQAEVYKKLFKIFLRHSDVIDRVTFWGVNDNRSWRRGQAALIFDGQMNPKPSFFAIVEAAKEAAEEEAAEEE